MKEHFTYKFDDLFNPTITALHSLGGSGSVEEIEEEVAKILNLSDLQVNEIHQLTTTKLNYRLAWARNYLKRFKLIENSSRGIWALTKDGLSTKSVDKEIVKKFVRTLSKTDVNSKKNQNNISKSVEEEEIAEEIQKFSWQEKIIEELQGISPASFERLCQRLLRELGFLNVEVTGQTNDGGIDGKGLLRIGGVLSFHVIFQAKRYKGTVSSSTIRDFRGAMVGRADKGLILTTGTYSREAKKEASRDGTTPIDLLDGNDIAEKLKELGLGVEIEFVERVIIKSDWFKSL